MNDNMYHHNFTPIAAGSAVFPGGVAAGAYVTGHHRASDPLTQLVMAFKSDRSRDDDVAAVLATTHVGAGLHRPEVVVSAPVSSGADRFATVRDRVVELIGADTQVALAEVLDIPNYRRMTVRQRRAASRATGRARFYAADAHAVGGRTVLLLDDVVTSGETARCAEEALRRAGARDVQFVALASARCVSAAGSAARTTNPTPRNQHEALPLS